jgi:hypothetical protein
MPAITIVVGEALVGFGRYSLLGNLTALDYHYGADLAVPTAIAVALACCGASSRPAARPAHAARPDNDRWASTRWRVAAVAATGGLVASTLVSGIGWDDRWRSDPAHQYLSRILTSLPHLRPGQSLYDTPVPIGVMPFLDEQRHLSDLLPLAGHPVPFDRTHPDPSVVTNAGRIVTARFYPVATGVPAQPTASCPWHVLGQGSYSIRLNNQVGDTEYFLRIAFFQQRPTGLTVTLTDAAGHAVTVRGSDVVADQQLGEDIVALNLGQPRTVVLHSTSPTTNVCLTSVVLGIPVAQS